MAAPRLSEEKPEALEPEIAESSSEGSLALVSPPEAREEARASPSWKERLQAFRARHAKAELALLFFASFAYDILTLPRIDNRFTLTKQGLFLAVLGWLLWLELRWHEGAAPPRGLSRVWRFREDALHFLLGGLLSPYTLFYFKSASGLTSFLFLASVFGVLVANELPRFRARGPVVRVGLYAFCLTSYFAYLLPVVRGYYSGMLFLWAASLSAAVMGVLAVLAHGRKSEGRHPWWHILVPGWGVQAVLLGLYALKAIPPVPLSLLSSGIYHDVQVVKGPRGRDYRLLHEGDGWKPWARGDQDFRARPGDRVYFFASVFAPTSFKPQYPGDKGTRLRLRWEYDDPKKGWTEFHTYDGLYLGQGGRDRGFRTFAYLTAPRPGDWRVSLETEDGREVGRLSFTVTPDTSTQEREFKVTAG
ncbi:DUF2914 domain-containing protein [Cystobacter ferrugineus]|uniref:DUF2914 domain-containing protein n=1 Tax=Cystobacter ferrugineus TaxID=83449 RepID=A0A1L9BEZ5_9BACT|nr:DUF2914 domain-containing protein [Cystobacter ferrugineus]OJH40832.1 hypothetical protein BON30_07825 [Cystobacter ferrugineus]